MGLRHVRGRYCEQNSVFKATVTFFRLNAPAWNNKGWTVGSFFLLAFKTRKRAMQSGNLRAVPPSLAFGFVSEAAFSRLYPGRSRLNDFLAHWLSSAHLYMSKLLIKWAYE
jgi:hypothetical protein